MMTNAITDGVFVLTPTDTFVASSPKKKKKKKKELSVLLSFLDNS